MGKTTFMKEFLPNYAQCFSFVNADLIASGISPFSPEVAGLKAGKIMIKEIEGYIGNSQDFAFETTLSGKTYIRFLEKIKKKGYNIHLFFLWLQDVDLAIKRIQMRVKSGGHNVSTIDVKRRFNRGIYNFFSYYRYLVDFWILFDNSATMPDEVAFEKEGKLTVRNVSLFKKIERRGIRCHVQKRK